MERSFVQPLSYYLAETRQKAGELHVGRGKFFEQFFTAAKKQKDESRGERKRSSTYLHRKFAFYFLFLLGSLAREAPK